VPNDIVGVARRASLVSTYGVGSILPVGDDSVMIRGLDEWPEGDQVLEPRLAASLGVSGFRSPPTWRTRSGDIPAVRFPEWAFCPRCRTLGPSWQIADPNTRLCLACSTRISPSRFVSCCRRGHIEDFPYRTWAHHSAGIDPNGHQLTLVAKGHTSALGDLAVRCECGAERSMAGTFDYAALRGLSRCSGSRPWLATSEPDSCSQELRTLQRGSANVWYAVTRSAISIPSVRILAREFAERTFRAADPSRPATELAGGFNPPPGCTTDDVAAAIEEMRTPALTRERPSDAQLRAEEYRALVNGLDDPRFDSQFRCEPVDITDSGLPDLIAQVTRVGRLREVRALRGFTRIMPLSDDADAGIAPITLTHPTWLPAVEVLGEGLFIRLHEPLLTIWSAGDFAQQRVRQLLTNQQNAGSDPMAVSVDINPRSLVLHSLAHILLNELALTSGYPAASLRERLYDNQGQSGILLYTATADSAGSLGGLAAQSHPQRLQSILTSGIQRARWCTTDPVCIESPASGVFGLNLAACHACALLPETSCERFNLTLDRATIVGTPDNETAGLFGGAYPR
jgi:hypothetical protein